MRGRLAWWSVACAVVGLVGCSADDPAAGSGGSGAFSGFGGGGVSGTGGFAAFGGTGGVSGVSGGASGAAGVGPCASVNVGASRVIPTVQLVIDGSGSMDQGFGGGTRWSSVHDALLGTDGVVRRLEAVVNFGMSIYQTGDQNSCPLLTGPAPMIRNFNAIDAAWLQSPGGSTPTAEAMETVVASMPGTNNMIDTDAGPQIIILATDGAPNGCGGGIPMVDPFLAFQCTFVDPMAAQCASLNMMLANNGYTRTLQAAVDAQAKGIDVYVLDLSDGGANRDELQKVANVGVGMDQAASPGAQLFAPANPAALSSALEQIIGGAATCQLTLQGMLTDTAAACSSASEVFLNSAPIACGDPNGWRVVDPTHIELVGTSCNEWLTNVAAQISARFPCNLVVPE